MAMKDYSEEFKAYAVVLYESTPGATVSEPVTFPRRLTKSCQKRAVASHA
jgi:hypothetical protein